jgi:hypothetical protein
LPDNFEDVISDLLDIPGFIAGAFSLRINSPNPWLRLIEWGANLRSRGLSLPYGDQAFFIRSAVFYEVGGFSHRSIMEDFELVRRLRKKGKIITSRTPVLTSPRRWEQMGIVRTTLINQLVVAAYYMGMSSEVIALFYRRKAKRGGRA